VNLRSCCVVPTDMTDFAKANNLKMLTHSDPEVMLDSAGLEKEVRAGLRPDYALRYQVRRNSSALATETYNVANNCSPLLC
jgi:glutamate--cysteine ligase regulatory subunit